MAIQKAEAMYPFYGTDADGRPLDGANRYTLRFAPGGLPPVNAFWSVTMYDMPQSLLVANPLDRYLINSPMLPRDRERASGRSPDISGLDTALEECRDADNRRRGHTQAPGHQRTSRHQNKARH